MTVVCIDVFAQALKRLREFVNKERMGRAMCIKTGGALRKDMEPLEFLESSNQSKDQAILLVTFVQGETNET
jgi:hypothetical protein